MTTRIVIMGGGLNGLTAGMLLARDGHRVTILERDAARPAGDAARLWRQWDRRGVNQFRQLHFMLPRWRAEMERELPEVIAELEALGGARTSVLSTLPAEMTGGPRDGDERFETVTARRPVLEAAVAAVARRTPGLVTCRGVAVTGLVAGAGRGRSAARHRDHDRAGHGDRRRPGDRRHRPAVRLRRHAGGHRRPPSRGGERGLRVRVLRPPLPLARRVPPGLHGTRAAALRGRVDPDPAGRLGHLGGGIRHLGPGQAAPRAAPLLRLGGGPEAVPDRGALG